MRFLTRKLVMLEQLNSANRLFGGALLCWVDKRPSSLLSVNPKRQIWHPMNHYLSKTLPLETL